jgi:pimeloyl-ACP methyl ester carboxylesterase
MQSLFLSYRSSSVHYTRIGEGSDVYFCFHGYGEQGQAFSFFENNAINNFSFYAIDLPFHGQTEWKDGFDFTPVDLQKIITIILETHYPSAKPLFSIVGFSMGSRVALSIYQVMSAQVKRMVLLAPDGLKVNGWYWLATRTWIGNRLFAFTMKHPGWFFILIKLFRKSKLINTGVYKFAYFYVGDQETRRLLYSRWMNLRKFSPGKKIIRSLIRNEKTPVNLVYGRYDRIIMPAAGEKFRKGIEAQCDLHIIASGHQVLQEKNWPAIMPLLLDQDHNA